MDLTAILRELREHRDAVDQAIASLERVVAGEKTGPTSSLDETDARSQDEHA
jgi:hypothetical protein